MFMFMFMSCVSVQRTLQYCHNYCNNCLQRGDGVLMVVGLHIAADRPETAWRERGAASSSTGITSVISFVSFVTV